MKIETIEKNLDAAKNNLDDVEREINSLESMHASVQYLLFAMRGIIERMGGDKS